MVTKNIWNFSNLLYSTNMIQTLNLLIHTYVYANSSIYMGLLYQCILEKYTKDGLQMYKTILHNLEQAL